MGLQVKRAKLDYRVIKAQKESKDPKVTKARKVLITTAAENNHYLENQDLPERRVNQALLVRKVKKAMMDCQEFLELQV
jgi:hypothetical protein